MDIHFLFLFSFFYLSLPYYFVIGTLLVFYPSTMTHFKICFSENAIGWLGRATW